MQGTKHQDAYRMFFHISQIAFRQFVWDKNIIGMVGLESAYKGPIYLVEPSLVSCDSSSLDNIY